VEAVTRNQKLAAMFIAFAVAIGVSVAAAFVAESDMARLEQVERAR
jgi:hypothetical protein